ncbi:hypothetical protein [Neisseria sp. 74A18]|uniref:hypothetical protein n=1 Tax=Neisseria sp. 74A18 TaxID=1696094 RepID=UPI0006CAE469|nr:hypothetical protein [Neisseria sp. 74A18]KPN73674.1 hypothetical protein AKG43_06690 [Neisseria sp. 74A18]
MYKLIADFIKKSLIEYIKELIRTSDTTPDLQSIKEKIKNDFGLSLTDDYLSKLIQQAEEELEIERKMKNQKKLKP